VERIGELSGGEPLNHTREVLDHIKATISEANQYVWIVADQPVVVGRRIGELFSSRDLPVRLMCEPTVDCKILMETRSALPHSEVRILQEVKVMVSMNESIAGVFFSGLDAKVDFGSGFSGKDAHFHEWCRDLFEYCWSRSRRSALV